MSFEFQCNLQPIFILILVVGVMFSFTFSNFVHGSLVFFNEGMSTSTKWQINLIGFIQKLNKSLLNRPYLSVYVLLIRFLCLSFLSFASWIGSSFIGWWFCWKLLVWFVVSLSYYFLYLYWDLQSSAEQRLLIHCFRSHHGSLNKLHICSQSRTRIQKVPISIFCLRQTDDTVLRIRSVLFVLICDEAWNTKPQAGKLITSL